MKAVITIEDIQNSDGEPQIKVNAEFEPNGVNVESAAHYLASEIIHDLSKKVSEGG